MDGAGHDTDTTDNSCQCYINAVEIEQGQWKEDPSQCLQSCRTQFLQTVQKEWKDNSGWFEGCKTLNSGVPIREFWSLYWCDSTFCGVAINQTDGLGQDRE